MSGFSPAAVREFHRGGEFHYNTKSPIRWVLSHMLRYPLFPLLVVIASVVNNFAYSSIQVSIGRGFDSIMKGTGALVPFAIAIAAAALVQGITGLARNFSIEFLAQRIERDSREEHYADLLGKDQTFHGRNRVGDLMARSTYDIRMLNFMFSPGLLLITDSFFAYLVPLIMIGIIHPALLITPSVFTALLVFTVFDYNRRLDPVTAKQQEQFGVISAELEEAMSGIVAVKANARESYEWDKFTGNARLFRNYFVEQGLIQAKYWPMLVFAVCWGLAFLHGLFLWRTGVISLGDAIGFLGLFGTFRFVTFISLFSFNLVQRGMAGAERIFSILKTKTDLDQNTAGTKKNIEGSVEFRNVSFGYGETPAVTRVSFRVEPGETVAIVGQTGSGKTTMTRLINRIFDPDEGTVLIDGIDAKTWNLESLRSQVSAIEQDVFLFSRSIRENIAFGKSDADMEQIVEAAKQAQAHDFIIGFKDGYDTVVGERGVMLSGGQKQRIAIARAFLANPRILILDDSTSAIDSRTEDEIQKAMRSISRHRTTFIITHRLSQIRWADRILVLKRGELAAQGRHEQLLETCTDYRRIFTGL